MKLQSVIVLLIILFIYRFWFSFSGTLSSGDWPYLYLENIKDFSFSSNAENLWLSFYYQIPTKVLVQYLNIPWEVVERALWFIPFLLLSIFSSYKLTLSWIGVLIYTTNTYILMVVGGGQMGVAMSYALAPAVLASFINLWEGSLLEANSKLKIQNSKLLLFGALLGFETMFDPRIAYVTGIAILLYWIYFIVTHKNNPLIPVLKTSGYLFGISTAITFFVNSFWIIPLLQGKASFSIENLGSLSGFKFLSFADFPHAFSLLHPNWPENIFGKVYFLQPEFLILPILAFLSLFIISNKNINERRKIVYFSFLAILGAFLAKGSNPPFGGINVWLFEHVPGMSMFRDASKFYLLIILGYAFLIPWSLEMLSGKIRIGKLFPIIFILLWCVLIRQAILGELGGTFRTRSAPQEYIELKDYIISQPQYLNSFWIPSRQRFGFSSASHPGISSTEILGATDPVAIAKMISGDSKGAIYAKLKKMNIKYVVVPYDSEGELFIRDRKYSDTARGQTIKELNSTHWLSQMPQFTQNIVYKVL